MHLDQDNALFVKVIQNALHAGVVLLRLPSQVGQEQQRGWRQEGKGAAGEQTLVVGFL